LLSENRTVEAELACRRVLTAYPHYIRAYGLLGETLIARGDYDRATGLYQRVLGADPENLMAYAQLSRLFEARGLLDEAIWHLERAFELEPGSHAIRASLSRLYQARSIPVRGRLKMNRAALARCYMRGQLYGKAADELAPLVREFEGRLDLLVSLAEALWFDGETDQAERICQEILASAPYCLKASLILGKVWLGSDRDHHARTLLQQAQALDPENGVANELFGSATPLPRRTPRVPQESETDSSDEERESKDVEATYQMVEDEEGERAVEQESGPPARPVQDLARRLGQLLRPRAAREGHEDDSEQAASPVSQQSAETISEQQAPERSELPDTQGWQGKSLLDVLNDYVEEHPEDVDARLDLARRYRDVGDLAGALGHYRALVEASPEVLPGVVTDLEFLNNVYPRTHTLLDLLERARERSRRHPS
jgi:tetratricopeptide (TPR) repeat protein